MTKTKTILGISLAAVFVFAMITNPVFAAGNPRQINDASVSAGTITIEVAGKAGINVPDDDKIFGYVVATNAGTFIVASHLGIDDDDASADYEWHSHSFTLDGDFCVATIDNAGTASIDGNTITITGTSATEVLNGFFVMLKITEDPVSICVHKIFKFIEF